MAWPVIVQPQAGSARGGCNGGERLREDLSRSRVGAISTPSIGRPGGGGARFGYVFPAGLFKVCYDVGQFARHAHTGEAPA